MRKCIPKYRKTEEGYSLLEFIKNEYKNKEIKNFEIINFNSSLLEKIDVPKSEQVIPDVADAIIKSGEATIKVLDTESKWFGVTYAEDRLTVVNKLIELHKNKVYPEKLF